MDYSVKNVSPSGRLSVRYSPFGAVEKSHTNTVTNVVDRLDLGSGPKLDEAEAVSVILERIAYRLWSETAQAREEMGVPWDALATMSPPYSAGRVIDESIKAYERSRMPQSGASDDADRRTFGALMDSAADVAIEESRQILKKVNALTPGIEIRLSDIAEAVHGRIHTFVAG